MKKAEISYTLRFVASNTHDKGEYRDGGKPDCRKREAVGGHGEVLAKGI